MKAPDAQRLAERIAERFYDEHTFYVQQQQADIQKRRLVGTKDGIKWTVGDFIAQVLSVIEQEQAE